MTDVVSYSLIGKVATLTMDDGKVNAISPVMSAALDTGLNRAAKEAQAIVIRGRDGVFCGGFDLTIIQGDDYEQKTQMHEAGMALLKRIYMSSKPIIFAVTGHAVAMGALLILTGDARIGLSGNFRIGLNETSIGLTLPITGLELARDRLDPRFFQLATINAEFFSPEDAVLAGYLDHVTNTLDFDSTIIKISNDLATINSKAFSETKRRVRQPTLDRIAALEQNLRH